MRIVNFGSINIDHVYAVDHFVRPGETLTSNSYQRFAGGKGFNQSIALARSEASVRHVGKIGDDGLWLRELLAREGADVSCVTPMDKPTGHAVIQVNRAGENAIVLHGGANQTFTASDIASALADCNESDCVLVQNEINDVSAVIKAAADRGLRVVFNPAPMTPAVSQYPLDLVNMLILNEIEAADLTGTTQIAPVQTAMRKRFPRAAVVLTLGKKGAVYFDAARSIEQPAFAVKPVDTTAAGDTFVGFFLAKWLVSGNVHEALELGCKAAATCVTRHGAAESIPRLAEINTL